jgi:predicted DNA-binding protein (UPF0251 family)
MNPTDSDILARLDRIEAILRPLSDIALRKVTQAEQAKRLGITRQGLQYRLKRARSKAAVQEVRL